MGVITCVRIGIERFRCSFGEHKVDANEHGQEDKNR